MPMSMFEIWAPDLRTWGADEREEQIRRASDEVNECKVRKEADDQRRLQMERE